MPDHKTHDKINLWLLLIAVMITLYIDLEHIYEIYMLIFSIAYIFGTIYLSPDLDIDSRIYDRWGPLKILWYPYKKAFKHRQASHHLILGPVSLIGYLVFLILIIIYILIFVGVISPNLLDIRLLAVGVGLIVAIEIHILSDKLLKSKN